jgi:thiol-disulfide isomerase/thioredoxin
MAYHFKTSDSGIKVDTPELQAFKATTDIAPCPKGTSTTSRVDGGLPSMTLPCLGGGRDVDLASLRGPLLVNFWAQNCTPCKQESTLLEQLSRSERGKVGVVGVDFIDPMPGLALVFAKNHALSYPQIADPAGAAKGPLRISGLPYTFFVNAAGTITYTQVGPITSQSQLAALVRTHLGVNVAGLAGS